MRFCFLCLLSLISPFAVAQVPEVKMKVINMEDPESKTAYYAGEDYALAQYNKGPVQGAFKCSFTNGYQTVSCGSMWGKHYHLSVSVDPEEYKKEMNKKKMAFAYTQYNEYEIELKKDVKVSEKIREARLRGAYSVNIRTLGLAACKFQGEDIICGKYLYKKMSVEDVVAAIGAINSTFVDGGYKETFEDMKPATKSAVVDNELIRRNTKADLPARSVSQLLRDFKQANSSGNEE